TWSASSLRSGRNPSQLSFVDSFASIAFSTHRRFHPRTIPIVAARKWDLMSSARIDPMLDVLSAVVLMLISPDTPAATLKFTAPAGWTAKAPSTPSRVAEFILPKADGDKDDATLIVYFFGAAGGGS